jgi:glycosyltransferase involved in cell wall biosynthesis
VEQLAGELRLGSDFELRPFLSGPDLARAARAASVVVIPSRWEEPGATIAVELFACGAAVIASGTGAQGEIFADHGRLFPNGDVAALALALERHFVDGPVYPRPTRDEPWSLPAIRRELLSVIVPV